MMKINNKQKFFYKILKVALWGGLGLGLLSCASPRKLASFSEDAKDNQVIITEPRLNLSIEDMRSLWDKERSWAESIYNQVGQLSADQITFDSTLFALEQVSMRLNSTTFSPIYFLWNVSPDEKVREAAKKLVEEFEKWEIQQSYRKDIYKVIVSLSKKKLKLNAEQSRLLDLTMKYYKQLGLHLSDVKLEKVKALKEKLSELSLKFSDNINKSQQILELTKEQLAGVPESYLKKWDLKEGRYLVDVKLYSNYEPIITLAKNSEVRKSAFRMRGQTAMKTNTSILNEVVQLRARLARLLGYKTWADLKLELKMAKTPNNVFSFLSRLNKGLEPKLKQEYERIRLKKAQVEKSPKTQLQPWDVSYYFDMIAKEEYKVDNEEVKKYFSLERSLKGMFEVYEHIFGVKFLPIEPKYKWVDDLQLYLVQDSETKEPMGLFYLDLYPRKGKYSHFAKFSVVSPGRMMDGRYQRPTVALVCNFPRPTKDQPSLLLHESLSTLFHEFGHAMHSMLTRAEYSSMAGTSVPRDFVEAPSQMLENWVLDKDILDRFARHYKDPDKKFPEDLLAKIKQVQNASRGRSYKYQLAIALTDMKYHTLRAGKKMDVVKTARDIFSEVAHVDYPKDVPNVTRIGHFMGYDAGYYGYLWAEAISQDMAEVFEKSPQKYMDATVGRRLRDEVYSRGNSRDIDESIEKFLQRKRSLKPFLKKLGLE